MKQKISILTVALLLIICTSTINAAPFDKRRIPKCYRKSAQMTQYWIPKEGEKDTTNDGNSITLNGAKIKKLKTSDGKTIAKVSMTTYETFQTDGTGLLESGILVNLGVDTESFVELDHEETPFGLGSDSDSGLEPWVSAASNNIKKGTTLYIKELDGLELPDGKTHNGCVRADDFLCATVPRL